MFGFLKEKLKGAISVFSKKAETPEELPLEKEVEETIKLEEPKKETKKEKETKTVSKEEKTKEPEEKKGFFQRTAEKFTKTTISEKKFEELFEDIEIVLLENNLAVEVIDKIKLDLKEKIVDKLISKKEIETIVKVTLNNTLKDILTVGKVDFIKQVGSKKPYVICFFGINGSGKTTTIAKIVKLLQKNKLKSVIAASDTFRAASIEQLEEHANKLNTDLVKHQYKSDPAAVAFDAIKHAKSKNIDVVLVDTAGRMHSNVDLMREMEKINRVAKPDMKIFIGESITGNDCIEQAKSFNDAIGIDGIILTKADVDEKGGAAISIGYVTKKPILFLGIGQTYDSLEEFNSEKIIKSIGL